MSRSKQILKKYCPSMDEIFLDDERRAFRKRILDAMEEYGKECSQASLEKASEHALVRRDFNNLNNNEGLSHKRFIIEDSVQFYEVDRRSIINEENIVLL